MKRFLLIALLFAAPLTACAQPEGVLPIASTLIDNTYTIGRTSAAPVTLTQRVLSATAKRQGLYGISRRESVIRANASVTGKFITNSTFGSNELVYTYHEVRNLTIDGQRYADPITGVGQADVADNIEIDGMGNRYSDNVIKNFWGSGVVLHHDQYCESNHIQNCFHGIEVVSSDVSIGPNNIVSGCRDYGIYVHGTVGNVHSSGNHYYGHVRAGYINAGTYWASGDMYADASYGLYAESSAPRVSDCTFQHNYTACLVLLGPGSHCQNNVIDLQRVVSISEDPGDCYGVIFGAFADYSEFAGGTINFTDYKHPLHSYSGEASTGIQCAADQVSICTKLHDNDGIAGTLGVEIVGAVNGVTLDLRTKGFHEATDQILVVDNAAADGIYGSIWLEGRTTKAIVDYVTLPSGWDGQITVYDVTNGGAPTVLTGPTAY